MSYNNATHGAAEYDYIFFIHHRILQLNVILVRLTRALGYFGNHYIIPWNLTAVLSKHASDYKLIVKIAKKITRQWTKLTVKSSMMIADVSMPWTPILEKELMVVKATFDAIVMGTLIVEVVC